MHTSDVFGRIKREIDRAPRNGYAAELHLQVIKYADQLEDVPAKVFCEKIGVSAAWGTEFAKMKKIAQRLRDAGLKPELI